MKTIPITFITSLLLFFNSLPSFSQSSENVYAQIMDPYPLQIAFNKTTNLVFPFAIKGVDKGSNAVLAQKAHGADNILQVKAGRVDFKETNLTVITADGKLHSFLLNFRAHPEVLTVVFQADESDAPGVSLLSDGLNTAQVQRYANLVASKRKTVSGIRDKKHGIKFSLEGLFIHGEVMYYKLRVENGSNIPYDIDQLRFFIRDRIRAKRTAVQETEIQPLLITKDVTAINGQSEQSWVYAVPKLTIPQKKYLNVQLMEKNGGRHLELKIRNKTLMQSGVLGEITP